MAGWTVSDAGSPDYNGNYPEFGIWAGKPYYKLDDTHFLFWVDMAPNPSYWCLGDMAAENAYFGEADNEVLPANPWSVGDGAANAPVVSAWEVGDDGDVLSRGARRKRMRSSKIV